MAALEGPMAARTVGPVHIELGDHRCWWGREVGLELEQAGHEIGVFPLL